MMGILDVILAFSKGREPTLPPRVPLQWSCSEEKGCLKLSLGETQRGALQRKGKKKKKPAFILCGDLCIVLTLVSFTELYNTRKKCGLPGKEATAKISKLACVLLKNI